MAILIPILIKVVQVVGATAVFTATEATIEKLITADEDTIADEFLAGGVAAGFLTITSKIKVKDAVKAIPMPANVNTPEQVADFLDSIRRNKKGLAALNARLGGFAPLAIKFTKALASVLTRKGLLVTAGVVFLYKIISWLVWLPQLVQQFTDQGVFSPEQANLIMEEWGLPWRWPISETRRIDTELERLKLERLQDKSLQAGRAANPALVRKTIIRMVEQKEPEQFIGTLFSAKLGDVKSFSRVVDDEITDQKDLEEDIKLNLNAWLATLPGRLGYSVIIRKDPVDHAGVKQSGIWATLTLHFTRLSGPIQPIDTILLGPVSPATRLKLTKTIKTIESHIPDMISGQEIIQVEVPGGSVDIFDTAGERVDMAAPRVPAATAPVVTPPTKKTEAEKEVEFQEAVRLEAARIAARATPGTPPQQLPDTPSGVPETPTAPLPGQPSFIGPIQLPTSEDTEFNVNEFEGGVRGDFIPKLNVFKNQILKVDTGNGNLNVRDLGSLTGVIKFKIANGTKVIVDSWEGTADGHEWARIRTLPGNKAGVVAATFLSAL